MKAASDWYERFWVNDLRDPSDHDSVYVRVKDADGFAEVVRAIQSEAYAAGLREGAGICRERAQRADTIVPEAAVYLHGTADALEAKAKEVEEGNG